VSCNSVCIFNIEPEASADALLDDVFVLYRTGRGQADGLQRLVVDYGDRNRRPWLVPWRAPSRKTIASRDSDRPSARSPRKRGSGKLTATLLTAASVLAAPRINPAEIVVEVSR
jgi:hypothetical protein